LFLIQEKCSWTFTLKGTDETLQRDVYLLAQHAQANYSKKTPGINTI